MCVMLVSPSPIHWRHISWFTAVIFSLIPITYHLNNWFKSIPVGDKPVFNCELCPTTCGRKTDLRIHVQKLHTADKPLKCKRCGNLFPDRYSYKVSVRMMWCEMDVNFSFLSAPLQNAWRWKMLQMWAVSICVDISATSRIAYAYTYRSEAV